jgi:hypothetical protein
MTLSMYSISSVSSCHSTMNLYVPRGIRAGLTSPLAASDKLPPSNTPRMRKSNGTTRGSASAVLMSCESWKRRHDAGIMNFCGGSWYGVFVLNITGIEGSMAVEEDAFMFVCVHQKYFIFELGWDCRAGFPESINLKGSISFQSDCE